MKIKSPIRIIWVVAGVILVGFLTWFMFKTFVPAGNGGDNGSTDGSTTNDNEPSDNVPVDSTSTDDTSGDDTDGKPADTSTSLIPTNDITTSAASTNCTIKNGNLMLINPNFHVEESFIANRRTELISLSYNYGIVEGNPGNGDNLMDSVAALHMNDMVNAYKTEYPGHTLETRSCFRSRGTTCGRLCLATGTSDHHTGLTCDLIDPVYGTSLDTAQLGTHLEWQWLKANSYKYGFVDRFPLAWAGGPMSEPMNVDATGTTGLYETWHYRYVGIQAATEIATGKYNNGEYDSLEHYIKAVGIADDLVKATCKQ